MNNIYAKLKETLDKGGFDYIIIEEAGYLARCLSFIKDRGRYYVEYLESWEDGRDDVEPLYDDTDYDKVVKWIYDEKWDNDNQITSYLKERGLL